MLRCSKLFVLHQGAPSCSSCTKVLRCFKLFVKTMWGEGVRHLCSLSSSHGLRELGLLHEVGDGLRELDGGRRRAQPSRSGADGG
jgi:hypothetical protein